MKTDIPIETAKLLFNIKALSLRPEKPFRYTSGMLSPIYIDNRVIFSFPDVRIKIVSFLISEIINKIGLSNFEILSGTASAAIPYTSFISQKLGIPMVYVRDSKKGHGKQNQVEGIVEKKQKVLIIEDHISTGGSTIGNARAIRDAGGKVKYAIAITSYQLQIANKNFKQAKLKVFTLTNIDAILKEAINRSYIKKNGSKIVLEWIKNPVNWGKKFGFEK